MLTHDKIKEMADKARSANQQTRQERADDLYFAWITQWDSELIETSDLGVKYEFDVLRKAIRQIIADLRLNPVQPDFKPLGDTTEEQSELMDGLYRASDNRLSSQEAYDRAQQEQVVCGFGAWEIYTDYQSQFSDAQDVYRRYIPEANSCVFWDPNDLTMDKRDSRYCVIVYAYSPDGYDELLDELDAEDATRASFIEPEFKRDSAWFTNDQIYVATFYHRHKVDDYIDTVITPFGEELRLLRSDIEAVIDDFDADGYQLVDSRKIKRWQVDKYLVNGKEILYHDTIESDKIPVVTVFGEYQVINGAEHWEGVTKLAKDPQRLRNFQLSYLADLVSRTPRPRPIFTPEQLAGHEWMYEENGADGAYPYLLQNLNFNGQNLPLGAVGLVDAPQIPPAMAAMIDVTRQAVEDVANPAIPQDIADPDLSGKAMALAQNMIAKQSYVYQHNMKFAKKRDAEIFASFARRLMNQPRNVTVELPDGTRKTVQVMQAVLDQETGDIVTLNDISNAEFDVYTDIGQAYGTMKEQTRESLTTILQSMTPDDPMRPAVMLKLVMLADGIDVDDIRKLARKQSILSGFMEPDTEEEMVMVQQAQNKQPTPQEQYAMAEAEARLMEGQAAIQKSVNDSRKLEIDQYRADTERQRVVVDAAAKGISSRKVEAETEQVQMSTRQQALQGFTQLMGAANNVAS